MTIPGLLIEYLIVGALALIWIYPVLPEHWVSRFQPAYLPILALGLYVVGMIVDFFAWASTSWIKSRLRAYAEAKDKNTWEKLVKSLKGGEGEIKHGSVASRQIYLAVHAPEAAKEAAMRSSRDRIARGAIINSILFTIFALPTRWYLGILMILVFFIMWVKFQLSSYSYEMRAEQLVKNKVASE